MKVELQKALDNIDMTYNELVEIANGIIVDYTSDIDAVVDSLGKMESLSNDQIRGTMLQISIKAFQFSNVKEKSAFKAECAEILRKEAYAKAFNSGEGSVANKDSNATLTISNEILSETIYNLVANLFKVKLDECHRLVSVLQTVLTSRMAEAKLCNIPSVD